ncbi:MAG: CHASE2 domain-containing protein [Pyrinomonadaceae bacterium]
MSPPESEKSTGSSKPLDAELRKDLLKMFAMAFPTAVIAMLIAWTRDKFANQPGSALLIIIPGLIVLALLFVGSTIRSRVKLGWRFLVFLPLYILVFFFAAQSRLLDGKSTLVGYDDVVPRNFLALNRHGDWHYRVASEEPPLQNLAIVLMKPPETYQQGRLEIADLIAIAQSSGARGVALDAYFVKYKADKDAAEKGIDELLCYTIERARSKGLKVLVAYTFKSADSMDRLSMDPDLEKCLPPSEQGHLLGYAESDGIVRTIPLYFRGDRQREAFSLKIARSFDASVSVPGDGLLQFIKTSGDFRTVYFDKLDQNEEEQSALNDRFILAGEDSPQDSFQTPYGPRSGVVIHAYTVQGLLHNHFIKRPPWWISLLMVSVWCYLMMVLAAQGVGNMKLILTNAAFSILIVAIAALVMHFWETWIDLVYPLLATWIYMFLLIILRKIGLKGMRLSNA